MYNNTRSSYFIADNKEQPCLPIKKRHTQQAQTQQMLCTNEMDMLLNSTIKSWYQMFNAFGIDRQRGAVCVCLRYAFSTIECVDSSKIMHNLSSLWKINAIQYIILIERNQKLKTIYACKMRALSFIAWWFHARSMKQK